MKNKVNIMWLGHSAVKIITPENKIILIDPFLSHNPSTPEAEKNQPQVDFILLTHGHEDHVGDTLKIAANTGAKVVAIVELLGLLKADGLDASQAVEMNKGGSVSLDGFTVTMVNANHSSSFGGRYAGDPAGLILRFANGPCLYHMGDTNISADFGLYGTLYSPDLTFIPIGDYYTMGVKEATLAAELIKSPIFVPIHYGTFPVLSGSPVEFQKRVQSNSDSKVIIPKAGEWLE